MAVIGASVLRSEDLPDESRNDRSRRSEAVVVSVLLEE
jgi:hypothetical protein